MANNGFTRKKVESLTLGEKLKKIRSEYRISLNEVSKNTKIQVKYLEYIENGEYEKLPADVYVRGFVRSYAHFLNADENVLIKLYERERNIQKNLKKDRFQNAKEINFHFPRVVITPKMFVVSAVFVLIAGVFVYLYREFQSFASVPYLVVYEPANGQVIEGNEVTLRGKTEKDARLVINGQPTLVREEGDFDEQIHLQPGLNTFTITSTNTFKKEKTETVSVQANYEVAPLGQQDMAVSALSGEAQEREPVKFEISVASGSTNVTIVVDGGVVYSGELSSDTKKVFDVQKEMKISSKDGDKTLVRKETDEKALPISEKPGEVKDISFVIEDNKNF